ncbi:hypothetical protein DERF_012528 [Dermatophagoides farinae]|uniref:BZIP domain-containing protein n=1 Tax=Dermatophagoides farinae TaxID=6954 RepID=A0A922HPQ9_DERFA|nr:hypothetical protein DERF_012528 [Dermatophagoides farinae]
MADFFKIENVYSSSFEQQQQQQYMMMDMNPISNDENNKNVLLTVDDVTTTASDTTSYHLLSNLDQDYYINHNFLHQPDMVQSSNINFPNDNHGNKQVDLGALSTQPVVINNTDFYYSDTNLNYSPIPEMISTSPQSMASNFSTSSTVLDSAIQTPLPQSHYHPFNYVVSNISSQNQSNVTNDWNYNNNNIDLSFFNQNVIPAPISSVSMSGAQSTLVNPKSMNQQQIKPTAAPKMNKPLNPKSNSNQSSDDLARKLEMKRERNRVAARKCRNKKLQLIEEYKKTNAMLQKDIEESEAVLRKINARKFELRAALLNALNSYPLISSTPSIILQQNNQQSTADQ